MAIIEDEREIREGLKMLVCGGVKRATVAWHMHNIYEKLQVHSKSEAVAKALRSGLIRRTLAKIPIQLDGDTLGAYRLSFPEQRGGT